jgi:quercetin dioxygenase-like cupin family protein
MEKFDFPPFLKSLPEADLPIEGLIPWLFKGEQGQVVLFKATRELSMPVHSHVEQWGIVVDGEVEMIIDGVTRTYRRGDSYHLPAGTPHGALIREGAHIIDFFADPNRYRARPR